MNKFVRNLLTEWRKLALPFDDKTFVIAVSGGADSVGLAAALKDLFDRKKLKLRFVIAHFNHDLRGAESEKDAKFVEDLAKKLDLEFIGEIAGEKFRISKKGNLEQNARLARYGFLLETAEKFNADGILTAHTINDQAETFLLNLLRGSGIDGLSAMKAVIANYELQITNSQEKSKIQNPKSKISLVRPLLNWAKREDTEDFCRELQIGFRKDAMNEDLNFKRVRVRKILLPVLKEFNPKIIETLAKTANLLEAEIEILKKTKLQKPKTKDQNLNLKDLKTLAKSTLYQVLREWLAQNRGNLRGLELNHIEAIEQLIFTRKSGRIVELPNGETIVKKDGKLSLHKRKVEKSRSAN